MPISPISWTILQTPDGDDAYELTNEAVTAPWIPVCASWRGVTHLQIIASGVWKVPGQNDFGPDGLAGVTIPNEPVAVSDCFTGALIGKFGGSSAALGPASAPVASPAPTLGEAKAFAIGAHCVVAIPTGCIGPFFVSFNGLPRPLQVDSLKVTVRAAPSAT
jgi:hypothetical protein